MDTTEILRAERLAREGFAHGFSTRRGGVSEGAFASLNLGRSVGDVPERVMENHKRFAAGVPFDPERLFDASQVHGAAVITLGPGDRPMHIRAREADALVARAAGDAVAVRTADCVPVLFADRATGRVAAAHAGWRGIVAGVLAETFRALESRDPQGVLCAIGPSIGPCCFEVGDDVALELAHAAGDGIVIRRPHERAHVDLWRAVEHQLRALGIRTIDTLGACTVCDAERFFSYRRDGAKSGRMLSAIVAR